MAILSKGTTYADGDQITSTNLNALVDSATFASGAVESGGGIQLNGSGQLKVAGNLDIGTSNLTATGTVSLGTTSFAGDVTFDTTTLKVDASNNRVGIGTASPATLLDINDDAATGVGIRVTGGGGGGPLAQFIRDVSSSGSLEINLAGGDPQIKLTSSGSDVFTI